jgi:hypothetical protein
MHELRIDVSPISVASHYGDLLDAFVLDSRDAVLADRFQIPVQTTDTLMNTLEDTDWVACVVLAFTIMG